MKLPSKLFFFLIVQIIFLSFSKLKYNLNFEYLFSDEKEIFEVDLFSKPKNILYDYGENIFYSGQIETIEKYSISKLVNFNKTKFLERKNKKEEEFFNGNMRNKNELYKEKKTEKKEKYENGINQNEEQNIDRKINENKNKNYNSNNYQNIKEDPFLNIFYNDFDPFENIIKFKFDLNQKENNYYNNYNKNNNKYNNYYYNNDNENNYHNKFMNYNYYYNNNQNYKNNDNSHRHNNYNNQKSNEEKEYSNNNAKIIHHHLNDEREQTIKIIKFPIENKYKTNENNYNTNNKNYYKNRINTLYNDDPFSFFNEFNFNFDMDDPFNFFESRLNDIYGIRILSENNKKKLNTNLFSTKKHELLFFPNDIYFDYIEYLPKSTIILIPKQYTNQIQNYKYEDYYIFTVDETISLISSISKSSNNYHLVKLGQNFIDSNFILISMSVTIFICLLGSIIYSIFLKHSELYDILPVQRLASKLPIFLCLLNLLICLHFMGSYHESDGYFVIIKYLCLFLHSLFRSIFLSLLTLLLNGWMTLSFIGWAEKLNRVIPILIYEIITSISFEIIGFYNILPYNKIQLYYFRNVLENIIIASISFISLYKYYIPLNKKCK